MAEILMGESAPFITKLGIRAVNRTVYGYGRICTVSIRVRAVPYFTCTCIFSPFDSTVR